MHSASREFIECAKDFIFQHQDDQIYQDFIANLHNAMEFVRLQAKYGARNLSNEYEEILSLSVQWLETFGQQIEGQKSCKSLADELDQKLKKLEERNEFKVEGPKLFHMVLYSILALLILAALIKVVIVTAPVSILFALVGAVVGYAASWAIEKLSENSHLQTPRTWARRTSIYKMMTGGVVSTLINILPQSLFFMGIGCLAYPLGLALHTIQMLVSDHSRAQKAGSLKTTFSFFQNPPAVNKQNLIYSPIPPPSQA